MLLVVYYSEIRTLRPCVFVPQQVRNQMGSLCQQWRRHAGRHREVAFLGVTIITERKTLNSVIRLRTLFAIQPIFRKFPFWKSAQRFLHHTLAKFVPSRFSFVTCLTFTWSLFGKGMKPTSFNFYVLLTSFILEHYPWNAGEKSFFLWMRKNQTVF